MDLRSHHPYWFLKSGIIKSYPSTQKDEKTEVVIMGAGITGALVCWYLNHAGIKTIVVDKRHVGTGSTAASTALLQYEIDTPLTKLCDMVGEQDAVTSYQLCIDSIVEIENITKQLKEDCGFIKKPSMQYASTKKDVADLEKEYNIRLKHKMPVQWLEANEIEKKFGFKKNAAILSTIGAGVDAYELTHAILNYCIKKFNTQVFDKTEVTDFKKHANGMQLSTTSGNALQCKKIIMACGYESQNYLPEKVETFYSTYAIASEPFAEKNFWYKNALIWETADPYLYMRTTVENRVILGGKDVPYTSAKQRDKLLNSKVKDLEKSFTKLLPHLHFKTDFSWAGTFAGTKDGLPYIGEHKSLNNVLFALGFGGNGITFSVIAAQIIRDNLIGKKNKNAAIFKFGR